MATTSRAPRPRRPILAAVGAALLIASSLGLASAALPSTPGRKHGVDTSSSNNSNNNAAEALPEPTAEELSVAGKILPLFCRLSLTSEKLRAVVSALSEAVELKEFGFLAALGWGLVPAVERVVMVVEGRDTSDDDPEKDAVEEGQLSYDMTVGALHPKDFLDTYLFHIIDSAGQAARIGAALYAIDCVAVTLNSLGFKYHQQAGFSKKAANISYTIWAALRIGEFKQYLLEKAFRPKDGNADRMSRARLLNKVLNVVLAVGTTGHVLDMFNIGLGLAATSLLSFGGVGTLVLSLASNDLASKFVSGLVLSASDRFEEGDKVQLGDGSKGYITRMGLLYTDLRGDDEIITRIPNHQLANQRARNISRVKMCQVKQKLRFSYEDVDKIPEVVAAIKEEIRVSCPGLITDGSRPFRAHWQEFRKDHLEVVVDCHFRIKPSGKVYYDNRQRVLEAIARAVDRIGVKFTLPTQIERKRVVKG